MTEKGKEVKVTVEPTSRKPIWIWFSNGGVGYQFPMSYLTEVGMLLERLYSSHRYAFRPFLGGDFGIVATQI